MDTSVTIDTSQGQALLERIAAEQPQAFARALNRSAGSARTAMARAIREDMGLKATVVRERIHLTEARPDRLQAKLAAGLKRIPLIDFGARGPEPSRGKGRGVTAKIGPITRRYPHAFLARMASGHRGVFSRKGTARLPIYEMFGPSLGHVFRKYLTLGTTRAEEAFTKNIKSEFRHALRRA